MTINAVFMSKPNKTSSLTVDSDVDMTGYDFKADNVEANEVHADTTRTDHLYEHTSAHNILVDASTDVLLGGGATLKADHLAEATASHGLVTATLGAFSGSATYTQASGGTEDGLHATGNGSPYVIASGWSKDFQKGTITGVVMNLKKFGAPTGNAYCKIYKCVGTTSTAPLLMGTSAALDISTLTTDFADITFTFAAAVPCMGRMYIVVDMAGTTSDASKGIWRNAATVAGRKDEGWVCYYSTTWADAPTLNTHIGTGSISYTVDV